MVALVVVRIHSRGEANRGRIPIQTSALYRGSRHPCGSCICGSTRTAVEMRGRLSVMEMEQTLTFSDTLDTSKSQH